MGMLKTLKILDLYGRNISLRFMDRDTFTSDCGAYTTIILIISLIAFLTMRVIQICKGKLISVQAIIEPFNEAIVLNDAWNHQNLIFGFGVQDQSLTPYIRVESYFEHYSRTRGVENTVMRVNLENCSNHVYGYFGDAIPPGMDLKCVNVSSLEMASGVSPNLRFGTCFGFFDHRNFLDVISNEGEDEAIFYLRTLPEMRRPKFKQFEKQEIQKKLDLAKKMKIEPENQPLTICERLVYESALLKHNKTKIRNLITILQKLQKFEIYTFMTSNEGELMAEKTHLTQGIIQRKRSASIDLQKSYTNTLSLMQINSTHTMFKTTHQTGIQYSFSKADVISLNSKKNFLNVRLKLDRRQITTIVKKFETFVSMISFLGGLFKGVSIFLLMLIWPFREVQYYRKFILEMFTVCEELQDLEDKFFDQDFMRFSEALKEIEGANHALSKAESEARKKKMKKRIKSNLKKLVARKVDQNKPMFRRSNKRRKAVAGSLVQQPPEVYTSLHAGFFGNKKFDFQRKNCYGLLDEISELGSLDAQFLPSVIASKCDLEKESNLNGHLKSSFHKGLSLTHKIGKSDPQGDEGFLGSSQFKDRDKKRFSKSHRDLGFKAKKGKNERAQLKKGIDLLSSYLSMEGPEGEDSEGKRKGSKEIRKVSIELKNGRGVLGLEKDDQESTNNKGKQSALGGLIDELVSEGESNSFEENLKNSKKSFEYRERGEGLSLTAKRQLESCLEMEIADSEELSLQKEDHEIEHKLLKSDKGDDGDIQKAGESQDLKQSKDMKSGERRPAEQDEGEVKMETWERLDTVGADDITRMHHKSPKLLKSGEDSRSLSKEKWKIGNVSNKISKKSISEKKLNLENRVDKNDKRGEGDLEGIQNSPQKQGDQQAKEISLPLAQNQPQNEAEAVILEKKQGKNRNAPSEAGGGVTHSSTRKEDKNDKKSPKKLKSEKKRKEKESTKSNKEEKKGSSKNPRSIVIGSTGQREIRKFKMDKIDEESRECESDAPQSSNRNLNTSVNQPRGPPTAKPNTIFQKLKHLAKEKEMKENEKCGFFLGKPEVRIMDELSKSSINQKSKISLK